MTLNTRGENGQQWFSLLPECCRLTIKSFDCAFDGDQQRLATAINRFTGWYSDPAFADAIFFDIKTFFAIEADANVKFEKFLLHKMDCVDGRKGDPVTPGER